MSFRLGCWVVAMGLLGLAAPSRGQAGQANPSGASSSSPAHASRKAASAAKSGPDAGSVKGGAYRNSSFGFSCKIPAGWVLRTEEMNQAPQDNGASSRTAEGGCPHTGCVLLAAFARPPLAHGEDVNASIVIAAESASAYPGLQEAAQYFGPVTEIAESRGLKTVNPPYEIAVGAKALVRGDFQKDIGSRVMRQSTLVMLARGYAVSFTFIGGTEDEVEELIDGLSFTGGAKVGGNPAK
jgi:hypothetical protein